MIDQTQGWNAYYRRGRLAYMPELFVVRFFRALRNRGDFLREHKVEDWIVPPLASVLDFGCGNGRHTIFIHQEGWSVTGCDVSADALALLRDAVEDDGTPPRVDLISGGLPYPSHSFDIVVAHGVFDHIPQVEREGWTHEVARVLRPGGLLYASLIARSTHERASVESEQVLQDGEEAGLTQTFYTPDTIISEFGDLFRVRSIAYDNRGLVYPGQSIIEHRFWAFLELKHQSRPAS